MVPSVVRRPTVCLVTSPRCTFRSRHRRRSWASLPERLARALRLPLRRLAVAAARLDAAAAARGALPSASAPLAPLCSPETADASTLPSPHTLQPPSPLYPPPTPTPHPPTLPGTPVCVGWLRRRGGPPPAPPPRLPPPPQALARGRRTSRSAVAATGANRPRAGRPRAGLRSPEEDAAGACRRSPAERALRFTGTDAARRRPVGPVEPWPCAARQHRRHRALLAHKPLRHIRCCKVCPCPPAES